MKNSIFICLCMAVLLLTCLNVTFAQKGCVHDSIFLPELTIKNYELYQDIVCRLERNKIENDTLFMSVRNEIYYLDKPIWIRKLCSMLHIEEPGRLRAERLNRIVLGLFSIENYNSTLLDYISYGFPIIKGYFYINEVCIIVSISDNKNTELIAKIELMDSTSSGNGRFFTDRPDKRYGYWVGQNSIEMKYFVKKNKLKKIYEYVKK